MTESEARSHIATRYGVSRETLCSRFVDMVVDENDAQNLIAPGSIASIWNRHVLDSAQLLGHADQPAKWFDIGTGAGFPGMIVALLSDANVTMIEPRRRRADFLAAAAAELGVSSRCEIRQQRAERVSGAANVISARAVASLDATFHMARHLSEASTTWILPRGRSAYNELESARKVWHGRFHVKHSLTDPNAFIVIARDVRPI